MRTRRSAGSSRLAARQRGWLPHLQRPGHPHRTPLLLLTARGSDAPSPADVLVDAVVECVETIRQRRRPSGGAGGVADSRRFHGATSGTTPHQLDGLFVAPCGKQVERVDPAATGLKKYL